MLLLMVSVPFFGGVQMVSAEAKPLDAPMLLRPAEKTIVKGVGFSQSWTTVGGARHYEYESYNDANKTRLRARQEVSGTSKTIAKVPDGTFWWRVRAIDMQGNAGRWSELWRVTTDSEAPTIHPIETIGDKPVQGTVRFVFETIDKNPWRVTTGVFSEVPPNGMPTPTEDDEDVEEAVGVNVRTKATLNINTLTMPNGRETIIVNVEDRAGNVREERFYFTVANPAPATDTPPAANTGSPVPDTPRLTQVVAKASTPKAQPTSLPIGAAESVEMLPAATVGKVLGMETKQSAVASSTHKPVKIKDADMSGYWYVAGGFVMVSVLGTLLFIRRQMTS
jgi:hypothetical protein